MKGVKQEERNEPASVWGDYYNLEDIFTIDLVCEIELPGTGIEHTEIALANLLSTQCVVPYRRST